jgi:sulfide:quinone oxidoreductase
MTPTNWVTDDFAVAEQITADDVDTLAAAGFKSIICNRPDGESYGQPPRYEIQAVADEHAIKFVYMPVVSGQLTMEDIAAMSAALDELPKPILAFCRSGTRSIQLWGLASGIKGLAPEAIVSAGVAAGHDLTGVANWLSQQE